ncbi:MAG: hypothetical protein IT324_19550 [Anaerolineae bacterium]|nr:hypothetical protein [Anaerolineae bacterium]
MSGSKDSIYDNLNQRIRHLLLNYVYFQADSKVELRVRRHANKQYTLHLCVETPSLVDGKPIVVADKQLLQLHKSQHKLFYRLVKEAEALQQRFGQAWEPTPL